MKKLLPYLLSALLCTTPIVAIGNNPSQPERPDTARTRMIRTTNEYSVIVYERDKDSPLEVHEIAKENRGVIYDIFTLLRQGFSKQASTYTSNMFAAGTSAVAGLFTKKKDDLRNWEAAVQREMNFVKHLPMQTEISDFYRDTTTVGALDPDKMIFKGIGCRQYKIYEENGRRDSMLVFEIVCSIDSSETKLSRIIRHGKFELKVDSIKFNPVLCNLPNDSLSEEQVASLRIPFDFRNRKNLTFRLDATFYSSWMNEAIQVFNDQKLGAFQVSFTIPNESVLEKSGPYKGYFVYDQTRDKSRGKVNITGECFIVPRSFIHTKRAGGEDISVWGTGQYRVDMQFSETCQINTDYYYEREMPSPQPGGQMSGAPKSQKRKMLKDGSEERWKKEWKLIKQRRPSTSWWATVLGQAESVFHFSSGQWVQTFIDPIQQIVLLKESEWLSGMKSATAQGGMSQQGSKTGQQGAAGQQNGGMDSQQGSGTPPTGSVPQGVPSGPPTK